MPTFSYDAKNNDGQNISGIIEAAESRGAALALREQGLWPTRVEPISVAASIAGGNGPAGVPRRVNLAPFLGSVPLASLSLMYTQLATLIDAGIPIFQALTTLALQTSNLRLRGILRECAEAVNQGASLSSVLERHPNTFTTIQIELVRAGEMSGTLDTMAKRIAAYLEKEIDIRRKLKRETLYPKIVLFVAGLVVLLLGFLRAGSQGLIGQLVFAAWIVGLVFGAWWLGQYLNQFPAAGAAWDRLKLHVPGLGGVTRRYATARFARALASLYSSGVLLTRAVETAARACGNRAIEQQLLAHAGALSTGEGVSGMLGRSRLLSPMAVQMAHTGEQTGSLDAMMDKVADYLESEADLKSQQFAVFAGVGALVIAAGIVLWIALSFYVGNISDAVNQTGN